MADLQPLLQFLSPLLPYLTSTGEAVWEKVKGKIAGQVTAQGWDFAHKAWTFLKREGDPDTIEALGAVSPDPKLLEKLRQKIALASSQDEGFADDLKAILAEEP